MSRSGDGRRRRLEGTVPTSPHVYLLWGSLSRTRSGTTTSSQKETTVGKGRVSVTIVQRN